jgi:fatty acid desaturase
MTTTGEEFRDDERRFRGLPADVLRPLTQIDDRRAWLSVAETLGVIAACVALALRWPTPWVIAPAILIIATRQQACFVLAHDAVHYRLFNARWLNDLVGRTVATIVGISMFSYRVVHRLHHNHLYGRQDPDIPLHGGYPRGRAYLLRKLGKDLIGLTAWKTYAYFFGNPALNAETGEANRPLDDTSPALRQAARTDRWIVLAFHLCAPVAAFAAGYGAEYLLLWALPLVTVLQPILRLRAIMEHGAVPDMHSPLHAARTNLGPRWLTWLLFPHHVNYHIEHHLYPSIPHHNLPRAHAAMSERGLLDGAEVRDIRETLRMVVADRTQTTAAPA